MLPPLSVRKGLLLCAVFAGCSLASLAQTPAPIGGEESLNGPLAGDQVWPALAFDNSGGLLVWEDNRIEGGNNSGLGARFLNADASVSGAPFRLNSLTAGSQEKPSVARLTGGRYLAAWETRLGGKSGVFAKVVGPGNAGSGSSTEVLLSPSTVVVQSKVSTNWPGIFRNKVANRKFKFRQKVTQIREHSGAVSVAGLPDGRGVVVYQGVRRANTNTWTLVRATSWNGSVSRTNDVLKPVLLVGDWMQDVFLRIVDANGQPVGSEIAVNQYTFFNQRTPSVSVLTGGNILVTWISEQPKSSSSTENFAVRVVGRLFNGAGEAVSDEFVVSQNDSLAHSNPAAAPLGDGGFAVFWSQRAQISSNQWDVVVRKFNATGGAVGEAVTVNQTLAGAQFGPRVVGLGSGQMAVWTSQGQDGSREGVYGRALSDGVPVGNEFRVNTTVISRQMNPAVVSNGANQFLAVWTSYVGETGFDLFVQKYSAAAQAR